MCARNKCFRLDLGIEIYKSHLDDAAVEIVDIIAYADTVTASHGENAEMFFAGMLDLNR